jgi:hypothetical protein
MQLMQNSLAVVTDLEAVSILKQNEAMGKSLKWKMFLSSYSPVSILEC